MFSYQDKECQAVGTLPTAWLWLMLYHCFTTGMDCNEIIYKIYGGCQSYRNHSREIKGNRISKEILHKPRFINNRCKYAVCQSKKEWNAEKS